jgi:rod shape-determining protein MreC
MANSIRKSSSWLQFGIVGLLALGLLLIDTNTRWLLGPRNVLAVGISPIQYLASAPTRIGRMFAGVLSAEPDIKIAYENLRNEYFQLKAETLLLRTLQDENEGLRSLLDASKRLKEKITLAELINISIDRDNHTLLIGRGLRHGIYVGQAVIDDQGVIGQVTDVMPFNSSVLLITDPGHALPVQVQRTGLRAVAYGTGSLSELRVPFLNQNSDIQVGDMLLSSGLGGRFPSGYPVAKVNKVKVIQEENFLDVAALPIAQLDRSNHVLLLSREKVNQGSGINTAIDNNE